MGGRETIICNIGWDRAQINENSSLSAIYEYETPLRKQNPTWTWWAPFPLSSTFVEQGTEGRGVTKSIWEFVSLPCPPRNFSLLWCRGGKGGRRVCGYFLEAHILIRLCLYKILSGIFSQLSKWTFGKIWAWDKICSPKIRLHYQFTLVFPTLFYTLPSPDPQLHPTPSPAHKIVNIAFCFDDTFQ